MSTDNSSQPAAATAEQATGLSDIQKKLADCNADRSALEAQIGPLLQGVWTESLRCIEECIKNDPAIPNKDKDRLFQAYRARILNAGNAAKRQVPLILADYLIQQVFAREVVVRQMPRAEGPWGLPRGVKHPSERRS